MTMTEEQTRQLQDVILVCLKQYHQDNIPFQQVWARETQDQDDMPFLNVWAIYDGEPQDLDISRLNSFDTYLTDELQSIGIHTTPSISYIPQREADLLGTPWTH